MPRPTVDDFFRFVQERQLIWHKRFVLREPFPWTDDPVLSTYKFCNVYRELDKCTQYLMQKLANVPREQQLLNVLFFRFFNRYNLYEELSIGLIQNTADFSSAKVRSAFEWRIVEGKRVFNDAYIICPGGKKAKHLAVLEALQSVDVARLMRKIDDSSSPEEAFKALQIPLAGPFLACEFWTDLAGLKFFRQGWTDDDFVNIGPGAQWGLELLFGESNEERLHLLYGIQREKLGEAWKAIAYQDAMSNYPYLSLTNIEGSLCEFRKYWRLKEGKGKKRYYRGPNMPERTMSDASRTTRRTKP